MYMFIYIYIYTYIYIYIYMRRGEDFASGTAMLLTKPLYY